MEKGWRESPGAGLARWPSVHLRSGTTCLRSGLLSGEAGVLADVSPNPHGHRRATHLELRRLLLRPAARHEGARGTQPPVLGGRVRFSRVRKAHPWGTQARREPREHGRCPQRGQRPSRDPRRCSQKPLSRPAQCDLPTTAALEVLCAPPRRLATSSAGAGCRPEQRLWGGGVLRA